MTKDYMTTMQLCICLRVTFLDGRTSSIGEVDDTVKIVKRHTELRADVIDCCCSDLACPRDVTGGAPPTSRGLANTRSAREHHARPRAACVITRLPLAAPAAPPAPIGRPPPAPPNHPCFVPRQLSKRFIRLPSADRTTRLQAAQTQPKQIKFVN